MELLLEGRDEHNADACGRACVRISRCLILRSTRVKAISKCSSPSFQSLRSTNGNAMSLLPRL
eukprot:scaffold148_cov341-Pavlova_lutheri.AAC.10